MPSGDADDLTEYYREYRQHNEMGLAFDVRIALAQERHAGPECWAALLDAVREVALTPGAPTHGTSAAIALAQRRV